MNEKDKYEIRITADHNDGDYITVINNITEQEWLIIKPLCKAIADMDKILAADRKAKHEDNYVMKYDWNQSNYDAINASGGRGYLLPQELYPEITEEQFETFNELTPWCGEYGFHTIESVELCLIPEITRIV